MVIKYTYLGKINEASPLKEYLVCNRCQDIYENDTLILGSIDCPKRCGNALRRVSEEVKRSLLEGADAQG